MGINREDLVDDLFLYTQLRILPSQPVLVPRQELINRLNAVETGRPINIGLNATHSEGTSYSDGELRTARVLRAADDGFFHWRIGWRTHCRKTEGSLAQFQGITQ